MIRVQEQNDKLPFKMRADVTESKLGTEIDFMVFASRVEVTDGGTYLGCQQFGAPASLPRLAKYPVSFVCSCPQCLGSDTLLLPTTSSVIKTG